MPHVNARARAAIRADVINEIEGHPASIVTVPLAGRDELALAAMARETGHSYVNVIRLALWHYARRLDVEVPLDVFGVRSVVVSEEP